LHLNAAFTSFHSQNISAFPGVFDGKNKAVDIYNKYSIGDTFYMLVGLSYINDRAVFSESKDFTLTDPYVNLVYLTDFGLNLNAGFRYNMHSEYGNQEVYSLNPSYRFSVKNGYLKFMAAYATSYITPSLSQLFGQFGANPELEPETNRTFEAGTEWALADTFRTSLLYFNRKEDQYVYFDSAAFLNRNSSTPVRVEGIEWEVTWKPSERIRLEANYTYTHRDGDNAIRIPDHKLNAMAGSYLGSKTFCSLQYAYTGTRTDTDFNTFTDVQLDAYSLVNLYVSHELIPGKLKAYLDAVNLLNTDYTEITGFTTRGRNFMIGFSLEL
jgi:vitamin B12 transporter